MDVVIGVQSMSSGAKGAETIRQNTRLKVQDLTLQHAETAFEYQETVFVAYYLITGSKASKFH